MTNAMRFYPIWWLSFEQWMSQLGRTNTRILNDILLIKIFGLTYDILPSTIAGFSTNRNINGYQVQLVGCGLTNANRMPSILHTAVVNIVNIHRCLQIIADLSGEIYPVLEQIICSKGNPYTFLEYGDSGGPLFYQGNLMAINIAVCPKMDGGFHPDKLNIHISIEPYREFIHSIYNS
ncbi:PREDICTED: uncharacterized protein LOC105360353 [Ceratosolen solmsi marchali]|uniref:Uncharacterized protein LOC105360353 n=1 Tax=Ceratosolen solmsi marchali TaxID=326594 RepID=A0AAJ6VN72_9HYME|nr:PREDICTED: uncharacterized protein LOC105360353 [Ceratosolen solmsi marchali]